MSVLLSFTITADSFELGRVLAAPPGMSVELDRIVPAGPMNVPFVWATGEDHNTFAETVRGHPVVESLTALDRFGQRGLYRLEWQEPPRDLLSAIETSEAAILEASGGDTWTFRLRFSETESVPRFHSHIRDAGLSISIERIQPLSDSDDSFGLSAKQREALTTALEQGYFASPTEVQLDNLASELGITRQAVSKRIRLGNKKILERALLSATLEH